MIKAFFNRIVFNLFSKAAKSFMIFFQEFNALNVGHMLYVVSFMFYVIRAMDFFKLSAEMGPKVIMIFEMIKDLFFFIMILMLFVLAYSIGAQVR